MRRLFAFFLDDPRYGDTPVRSLCWGYNLVERYVVKDSRQLRRGRLAQEIARRRRSLSVMKITEDLLPPSVRERRANVIQQMAAEPERMEAEYHELNVEQIHEELKGGQSDP